MVSVVVRGRVPGREGIGDLRLEVAADVTARELIGAVVAAQLALAGQDVAVWPECSRLYLTDGQIAAMAAEGAIRLGGAAGRTAAAAALPAAGAAAARAVEAFERGVFVMFAGGEQVFGLDEPLSLRDGEDGEDGGRVTFLRLTALAGG